MEYVEDIIDIVIVGAGIAGLATALGLHRKGVKSLVLESSPTLRTSGYAIGTWTNAWHALDALGIGNKVREHHRLVERVVVLSASSVATSAELKLTGVQGKTGKHEFRSVRRDSLVKILAKELPKDTIRYSSKVVLIEDGDNLKLLHLADGSIIKAKVVVGCDGIYSAVAKFIGLKEPSFSGRLSTRGYAEYPTNHGFNPEFVVITGGGIRIGMLPNSEKSIYWFFTWRPSKKDKVQQSMANMREFVIQKLTSLKVPKEIIQVIERSEMSQVFSTELKYQSPFSLLFGRIIKGNICVIGDALHPMTPDIGQGGCMALEDSVILARCLSDAVYKGKIEEGLEKFANERRWRCAEVVARAYIVGFIQQSSNWFLSFLRGKVFARTLARALLKTPDYDCGKL
ncbi:hypothetical protein LUZ62_035737 [Rhynchospora pubera]|uniref:FAD-binding domain-containing protein n=1 Tax=Rhynchospora pubera TaxID=906938 RepID=A0AAV8EYD9_9POAL|nr:hypothetical protein LUZ62_035737 [Rhynchospora pubera]